MDYETILHNIDIGVISSCKMKNSGIESILTQPLQSGCKNECCAALLWKFENKMRMNNEWCLWLSRK